MKKTLLMIVRWLMITTGFLLVLAACILAASLYASFVTGQWHWFQRSGALLVSIGAILSTRRLLRVGLTGMLSGSSYFDMARRLEMITGNAQDLEIRRDLLSSYWGFGIVGLGTIIWAYGDLVACLIAQNMSCISQ